MKTRSQMLKFGGILVLLLQGCSQTSHPLASATLVGSTLNRSASNSAVLGKVSSSNEMERLMDQPGPIRLETINSADWSVPLSGLLNLDSPAARQAGLNDRDEPIQVYAHLLKHPRHGNFLVDTGVSKKLLSDPGEVGVNWLIQSVMHTERMKLNKSTAEILQGIDGRLSGIFFTHLHIDHISGMPDIPNDVPLYLGAGEATGTNLKNMFVQGATDQLLMNKQPLQEWHFEPDPQNRLEGVVDIFGDESVFAISVPGHTPGSTAYLVRTTQGPVLLTGDACHTRWGWDNTVEPGDFTDDNSRNLKNLQSLKALVARHPAIDVRLGHQR